MTTSYQRSLLQHAIAYARAGYYVFPLTVTLDDRGKKSLIIPFERADGWDVHSTRDEDTIRDWFSIPRKGMKGIAIDTGKSGIAAVDLDRDGDKDGFAEWEKLPEQQDTPMRVLTRSGGMHRFYRDPSSRVGVSAGRVAPGIDIRGRGGFVIAAPTRVWGSDGVYRLENGVVPVEDVPALTPGMIEIITTRQEVSTPRFDPAIHGALRVSVAQGEQIIENRLDRLRQGRGMRHAIFGYAVAVAQFEAARAALNDTQMDPDTLAEAIGHRVLEVVPWDDLDEEDAHWIWDGVTKGLDQPWIIAQDEDVFPSVETSVPAEDLLQREAPRMPGHPKTAHAIVAPVVVDGLTGRYLYVKNLGWHEWVGDRWSSEPQIPVRHAVQQMILKNRAQAKSMITGAESNEELSSKMEELTALKEARGKNPPTQREVELQEFADRANRWVEQWEDYSSWWYGLANGHDFAQVMKFVEEDPGRMYVTADQLDNNPNLLNCSNGTVDLRTGEIRRHDPADLITKSTRVPYDPKAQHEMWDKAREAFAPDVEDWLQLKVGEGAFGFPSNDDTMLFSFGNGSNGKSTLSDAILNALGDYAVFLHDKAILGSDNDHGTEKMVLRGARWGVLEELPEAQVLRPAIIKKLIGTSKITARLMRQDNVTFNATHSLLVNSNHRPQVLENDRGTWRRLIAVPWPWTFKFAGEPLDDEWERPADPAVKASLSRNMEVQKAALAWIVEGARKFSEAGGTCGPLPELVQQETTTWRVESDTFGAFFANELVADKGHVVPTKELLDTYNLYLEDLGKKPVSDTYIGGRLESTKEAKKVMKRRIRRDTKTLKISTRGFNPPDQFTGWVGLRWRNAEEALENTI